MPTTKVKSKRSKQQIREDLAGYLFAGPMLLGLLVFTLFPIIASFFLSFTNWNFVAGFSKVKFLGLDNFIKLIHDSVFLLSLKNNMILMIVVPLTLIVSLILAVLIDKQVYFKGFFK